MPTRILIIRFDIIILILGSYFFLTFNLIVFLLEFKHKSLFYTEIFVKIRKLGIDECDIILANLRFFYF